MRIRTVLAASAVAFAALGLAACSGGSSPASVVGVWGEPDVQDKPSLEFSEDGSYGGTDGCNVVGGDWTADGDVIDLGAMISTMMYCEGVDTWLTQSATAKLNGDTLVFMDEGDQEIGTLDRQK